MGNRDEQTGIRVKFLDRRNIGESIDLGVTIAHRGNEILLTLFEIGARSAQLLEIGHVSRPHFAFHRSQVPRIAEVGHELFLCFDRIPTNQLQNRLIDHNRLVEKCSNRDNQGVGNHN